MPNFGFLETEGATRIWMRSEEKHKLRYTSMISDGDSSTYPTIVAAEPYGKDHPVTKHECVGHVQKRMYNHLKVVEACGKRWECHQDGRKGSLDRSIHEEVSALLWESDPLKCGFS